VGGVKWRVPAMERTCTPITAEPSPAAAARHHRRLANVPLRLQFDATPAAGGEDEQGVVETEAAAPQDLDELDKLRTTSREMTGGGEDDPQTWLKNGAGRAMMMRAGFTATDFRKPLITVACPWTNASSCNHQFMDIAQTIATAIEARGGKALIVAPPVITDGVAMGNEGMKYSLCSRDLIADAIELHHEGHRCDAMITVGGCDKSQPGVVQPIARGDYVGITCYGGGRLMGHSDGRSPNFERQYDYDDSVGMHGAAIYVSAATVCPTLV